MRCLQQLILFLLCPISSAQKLRNRDQEGDGHRRDLQTSSTVTLDGLITSFQEARSKFITGLKRDYGEEYYETIFTDQHPNATASKTSIGRNAFWKGTSNARVAWERTTRKMMIRILEYMVEGKFKDYVWATAGDSGAAGHGNFFGEQYTMVLQEKAADLFASIGLNFVARPFAMHSSTSAPEVAACVKEIFGTDVDIIAWDFAMTDGRWHWRLEFFGHRVMLLPNHPTMLVLRAELDVERKSTVEHLVTEGMGAMRLDEAYMSTVKAKFPDSHYNTKLDSLTDHVKYFRCGHTIESGSGGCGEHKFTHNGTCDDRDGQNNWHHGWKWHAFHGNLYASFLMEIIDDALLAIKESGYSDWNALKQKLKTEEKSLFDNFEQSKNFKYAHKWDLEGTGLTTELFYHQRLYCHTARLPAQTRYKGYVFNKVRDDDWHTFKKGMSQGTLHNTPEKEMRITYAPREKHNCSIPLHIDSRDFFFATPSFDDFQTAVLPNIMEFKMYGPHKPQGLVAMCAASCTHHNCVGYKLLGATDINEKQDVFVQVNGEDVAEATRFDDCFLLKRESGSYYWDASPEGRYVVGINVRHNKKYFRISSFIVW